MVDLHSHILPAIDDGPKEIEESIEIVKNAVKNGVTDIVVTPHYIEGSIYDADYKIKKEKLNLLIDRLKKERVKINIYLGNEVFVSEHIIDLLKKGKINTLNNTRYLLFELPLNNVYNGALDLVFNLRSIGCIPIIAHPERYQIFKDNPELISKFLDEGALFQCNIGSFFGKYGKHAKELVNLLVNHHAVHFISSDVHHKTHEYYNEIKELKTILKKTLTNEEIHSLLVDNPMCVIKDEDFKVWKFIPFKKTLFGKLK